MTQTRPSAPRWLLHLWRLMLLCLGLGVAIAAWTFAEGQSGVGRATDAGLEIASASDLRTALAQAAPGDVLLLAPGDYGVVSLNRVPSLAAGAAPVTLRSADPARPAKFAGLTVKDASGLVLDRLLFDYTFTDGDNGAAQNGMNWPFQVLSSANITIRNSLFDGDLARKGRPVDIGFATGTALVARYVKGLTLEGNEIRAFQRGLAIDNSSDVVIRGNDIHSLRMDGMNLAALSTALIEGNFIHDFKRSLKSQDHADMIQFWTAGTKSPSTHITIRGNVLNSGSGAYTQSIFMRNELVDTGKAGRAMFYKDLLIEQNIIINAHLHGITVGEADGLTIRANTLIHNKSSDGPEKNPPVWIPIINPAIRSVNVTIKDNIAPGLIQKKMGAGWDISGNLTIQDRNAGKPNYYDGVFSDAVRGNPTDLMSFAYKPGGPAGSGGVGAAGLRPDRVNDLASRFSRVTPMSAPDVGTDPAGQVEPLVAAKVVQPAVATAFPITPDGTFINRFRFDAPKSPVGTRFTWDFDGVSAQGPTVIHDFVDPGPHRIVLTRLLPTGETMTSEALVDVPALQSLRFDPATGAFLTEAALSLPVTSTTTLPDGSRAIAVGDNLPPLALPPEAIAGFFGATEFELAVRLRTDRGSTVAGEVLRVQKALILSITKIGAAELQLDQAAGDQPITLRTGPLRLHDGNWHDVVVRFDSIAGSVGILIDGRLQAQSSITEPVGPMQSWGLSFGNGFRQHSFQGQIVAIQLNSNANRYAR